MADVSRLPIDIQVQKLLEWLLSRRHVKDTWQTNVDVIRTKITAALNDMPAHPDIAKLLSGSYLNYFHCLRIVEILRETEKDTKNFFGYYSSQRMNDWQEIIKLYEVDNVYLAEAAQLFFRNVIYEIPGVRRQIEKFSKEQDECERRSVEYLKNAEGMRGKFRQACKQMNIQGDDLKRELVALLDELPEEYKKITKAVADAGYICKFYDAMVGFLLGDKEKPDCVPVLRYLAEHGNVTTYEWRYNEPPLSVEAAAAVDWEFEKDDEAKRKDSTDSDDFEKIDFGEADAAAAGGDFIDFGGEGGEIDWGNEGEARPDNGAIDWCPGGQESLEISLEDAGITVESSGVEGGTARDEDALTLLDNPKTRNALMDDLAELEAFLERRLKEMTGADGANEGQVLALSLFRDAPAEVQMQTVESIQKMLSEVKAVYEMLSNVKIQHLFLIKSSPKYVDRLARSVSEKLDIAKKLEGNAEAMKQKGADAAQMQTKLQPELKLMIERTKVLQKQIEEDISKKYQNRRVNLMAPGLN